MSTAAIVMAVRNRYIRRFRQAGATTPGHSVEPGSIDVPESLLFKKMVRDGVLVRTGNDSYYLDEQREAVLRKKRLTWLSLLLLAILVILLLATVSEH
jgi:hypothetical protein